MQTAVLTLISAFLFGSLFYFPSPVFAESCVSFTDSFDTVNTAKWNIAEAPYNQVSASGGKAVFGSQGKLSYNSYISGDFTATATVTYGSGNGQFALTLIRADGEVAQIMWSKSRAANTTPVVEFANKNGSLGQVSNVPGTVKVRVIKTGETIEGYYWNGTSFVKVGSAVTLANDVGLFFISAQLLTSFSLDEFELVCTGGDANPTMSPSATPSPSINPSDISLSPTSGDGQCSLKNQGDANCDGAVTMLDYFYFVQKNGGGGLPSGVDVDFNKDGKVDMVDYNIVVPKLGGLPVTGMNILERIVSIAGKIYSFIVFS